VVPSVPVPGFRPGIRPRKSLNSTAKKTVTMNGRYLTPSDPMTSSTMLLRTNSTPHSPMLPMPLGTSDILREAIRKKIAVSATATIRKKE